MRHYAHPRNKRLLLKPDIIIKGANPSCGDELNFTLKLDSNKRIKETGWIGKGCTISQASASIFSELILGKTCKQIEKMKGASYVRHLKIELSPTRLSCALLPLSLFQKETVK